MYQPQFQVIQLTSLLESGSQDLPNLLLQALQPVSTSAALQNGPLPPSPDPPPPINHPDLYGTPPPVIAVYSPGNTEHAIHTTEVTEDYADKMNEYIARKASLLQRISNYQDKTTNKTSTEVNRPPRRTSLLLFEQANMKSKIYAVCKRSSKDGATNLQFIQSEAMESSKYDDMR